MSVLDMSPVIAPKSSQLTGDDLLSGDRIITITDVALAPGAEQPCQIRFDGDDGKPWYPCKSMGRVLVKAWGPDAKQYIGKSLQLFRDPEVLWAGMKIGGIRIKALSHIDAPFDMALTATRGKKAMARFFPLKADVKPIEQKQGGDDAAGRWANSYLAKVKTCATLEVLDAFVAEKAARLAELKDVLPNAHGQCVAAVEEKRRELSPNDGTLADDNPTAAEGAADEQRGDQFAEDRWENN